jgi:hypothetical protein
METHYHLALETPQGNLQRVMRHIDGVYTQRFNRLHQRNGPLFRGRYKAILIDADVYLVAVTRYVHLNPVEAGKADDPKNYPWSSHRYYLRPRGAPRWLDLGKVLSRYRNPAAFHEFVLSGNEEALRKFYARKRRPPILGNEGFIPRIKADGFSLSEEHLGYETAIFQPSVQYVVRAVAEICGVSEDKILQGQRGQRNEARQLAMYLTRELCGLTLKETAEVFSLGSYGSVGGACSVIERRIKSDRKLLGRVEQIREMVRSGYVQTKT